MNPPNRCQRCGRLDDLILGDGLIVCNPCVEYLTNVADDPRHAGPDMRQTLAELHSDVLVLVQPVEEKPDLLWRWLV